MQLLSETTKSPAKSECVEECGRELLDSLPPVMWFIRRQMRQHRGALSMTQFRSLVRVNRPPSASLSAVAEHLGASLPTTSRIVAGLVDKGLMARGGCRWDRRQVSLQLTPRGREVLQNARKATQQRMELELEKLSTPQRAALIKATKILKMVFGPASDPAQLTPLAAPAAGKRRKGLAAGTLA